MDFVCQFRLTGANAYRNQETRKDENGQYVKDAEGRYVNDYTPGVQVTFTGVQGGVFGKYTPNAQAQMTILNPEVAAFLADLWHDHIHQKGGEAPVFEVTFREIPHDTETRP